MTKRYDRSRTASLVATISLAVGASLSSSMGAYHFFLPWQFHWGEFVTGVDENIHWALFAINFFFSFLLVCGGILTFVALRAFRRAQRCDRGILIAVCGFWLANSLYQIFVPMPMPEQMWPLRVALLAFAMLSMLAYLTSLLALRAIKASAGMQDALSTSGL